ncbi:cyclase [Bauldia sp.]|uniref:cyclase n=1 Tax=Bauldia sp. TaxID=2575872 RepID=UPI003BABAADA
MVTLFARHRVTDYAVWREVYDAFFKTRNAVGVSSETVFQSTSDPNDVTMMFELPSTAAAQAFLENEELRKALAKGGLVGTPAVWIAEKT